MSDLRPTLFLAQLSNLLAGNISIVHGVTGSSRTFMGEEAAGVDAVRIGFARIQSGQSEIALVGGAQNSERKEMLLLYEFARYNLTDEFRRCGGAAEHPGFALGSMGAFLVLESSDSRRSARGAKPLARLVRRRQCEVQPQARRRRVRRSARCGTRSRRAGEAAPSSRARPASNRRRRRSAPFSASHPEFAVRATGTHVGHGVEPQFAMNVALAAIAVQRGRCSPRMIRPASSARPTAS